MKCTNPNKRLSKKGISLAETLLVMTIIGSIASFTIPNLIYNIRDAYLKVMWKETYSILNQANLRIMTDNGGSITGLCADGDSNCLKDLYAPYMKRLKDCPADATGNCWNNYGAFYFQDGSSISSWDTLWTGVSPAGIILANGIYVAFSHQKSNCDNQSSSVYYCGGIDVDVNGPSGPNMYGKDIFEVWQTKNGIKAKGLQGDGHETECGTGTKGWACSAMYLRQ